MGGVYYNLSGCLIKILYITNYYNNLYTMLQYVKWLRCWIPYNIIFIKGQGQHIIKSTLKYFYNLKRDYNICFDSPFIQLHKTPFISRQFPIINLIIIHMPRHAALVCRRLFILSRYNLIDLHYLILLKYYFILLHQFN